MENQNFTTAISVDQTAKKVFNSINNVDGWWAKIEGSSQKLNDVLMFILEKLL